jgi:hypothetical protein
VKEKGDSGVVTCMPCLRKLALSDFLGQSEGAHSNPES